MWSIFWSEGHRGKKVKTKVNDPTKLNRLILVKVEDYVNYFLTINEPKTIEEMSNAAGNVMKNEEFLRLCAIPFILFP